MKSKMLIKGEINVAGVYEMATKDGIILYNGSALEVNDALSRHLYNLKRGYYMDTNKRPLQEAYDREDLVFYVIHKSAYNDEVRNMTTKQKEDLQKALGVIEQLNIALNKKTVCNCQKSVLKHSSNKDEYSTIRRHNSNVGNKNPHVKYDEKLIAEILWLKENGYKPKQIEKIYSDYGIKSSYIAAIGIWKWAELEPIKPDFIKEKEIESTPIDTTSDAFENAQ